MREGEKGEKWLNDGETEETGFEGRGEGEVRRDG